MINCPVLHVNGDHPEGLWHVSLSYANDILNPFIQTSFVLLKLPSNTATTSERILSSICSFIDVGMF